MRRIQIDEGTRESLVVYTTRPEVALHRTVEDLDRDDLVSEPLTIATGIALAGVIIAGVGLAWKIGVDIYDRTQDDPQSGQQATECQCVVACEVTIDVSDVVEEPPHSGPPDGGRPDTGGQPGRGPSDGGRPDTGGNPDSGSPPDKVPEGGLPGGTPLADDDSAPNSYLVPTDYPTSAPASADLVIKGYLGSSFDSPEAALNYLEQESSRAGVEITIGSHGIETRGVAPDPAGIAARLREQGVTESEVVATIVDEVNTSLLALEGFVSGAQATVAQTAQDALAVAGADQSQSQNSAPTGSNGFTELVPQWVGLVPPEFALMSDSGLRNPPPTREGSPAGTLSPAESPSGTSAPQPSVLLTMSRETPSGARLDVSVATQIATTLASTEALGYHAAPFESLFAQPSDTPATGALVSRVFRRSLVS